MDQNLISNDLQMDANVAGHLKEAAGWAKFLGIVGFIVSGFLVIAAFFVSAFFGKAMNANPYGNANAGVFSMMSGMITVVYLIIAILGIVISLFTYKFGVKTKRALLYTDQESLDTGFKNLKFLFRFYGIVMIIYLGIIVLAMIGGVFGAMMGR
jgi:tryptophan-rich sensory protein